MYNHQHPSTLTVTHIRAHIMMYVQPWPYFTIQSSHCIISLTNIITPSFWQEEVCSSTSPLSSLSSAQLEQCHHTNWLLPSYAHPTRSLVEGHTINIIRPFTRAQRVRIKTLYVKWSACNSYFGSGIRPVVGVRGTNGTTRFWSGC